MNYYLPQSILSHIYSYISWGELRYMDYVSDDIWQQQIRRQDNAFKTLLREFWVTQDVNIASQKNKTQWLGFMNHLLHMVSCKLYQLIPDTIFYDVDWLILNLDVNTMVLPEIFNRIPVCVRQNRNFMKICIAKYPWLLRYADNSLRKDREIVSIATQKYGGTLQFADPILTKDPDIVLLAVKNNHKAIIYADISLRCDPDFFLQVLKINLNVLSEIHPNVFHDRNFMLRLGRVCGDILIYSDASLLEDPEYVLAAVPYCKHIIQRCKPELQNDKKFLLQIIKACPAALPYFPPSMQSNDIVACVFKTNKWLL